MKVVIAPDAFKECLSAADVAAALASGVLEACPDARIDLCPMADGGEGTVAAMVAATGGALMTADVFDPLGAPRRAHFGLLGRSGGAGLPGELGLVGAMSESGGNDAPLRSGGPVVAVVEMSAASGLALVPPERRDPLRTTTFGTGKLIMAALDAGATRIIVGVGGSATVDGGVGAAQAMGVKFIDANGGVFAPGLAGGALASVANFDMSRRDGRVEQAAIVVACDVTNPLTGPDGSARVYGPQKGATPEVVERLEAGLSHLAELIRIKTGLSVVNMLGAGAAGGLAAGLVAFAGARLERGVELVARTVRLPDRLVGADLCITGEGCFDAQTGKGKTALGVAQFARAAGVPVVCIPGVATAEAPSSDFDAVLPLVAGEVTQRLSMQQPQTFLRRLAARAVRQFS